MSIEKMEYVTIVGLMKDLDRTMEKCVESGCFHIADAVKESSGEEGFNRPDGENPYKALLKRVISIETGSGFIWERADWNSVSIMTGEELEKTVSDLETEFHRLSDEINTCSDDISQRKQALTQLKHLRGMKIDFRRLFECTHINVRFGRLPCDSAAKLSYYDDRTFIFIPYDDDGSYQWGFYFAPVDSIAEADNIFKTLYFEIIKVPEFLKDTPEREEEILRSNLNDLEIRLSELNKKRDSLIDENGDLLNGIFSFLKYHYDIFEMRKYVSVYKDKFYMVGFVPKAGLLSFKKHFESMDRVSVITKNAGADSLLKPPVKLKNNKFSGPFSMFVEMYGLPSYNGFNPTMLVAVTYTLLFGIMFGDLGQGLLLSFLGLIIYKKSGNRLGAILQRIGLSSAFFGLIYGSVFGFENALNPLYKKLGFEHKPLEIMENTMGVLIGAILIGVAIIFFSIIINIFIGFKHRDYVNAVFGNNGIAGFVFFGAVLVGLGFMLTGRGNIFTAPYVIVLIIIPVIVMFFREPLGCLVKGERFKLESGLGDFLASNFFEVFEFMLGYATNTLSFVRIGGFVFSHAGMMSVVMILSEMVSTGASPVVIVIGNLFVMGMEGLIVGIQVLRLEFYEIFSRFYEGNGHPFEPLKINYDTNIE